MYELFLQAFLDVAKTFVISVHLNICPFINRFSRFGQLI